MHGKEPAYETGGGLSASCYKWRRPAVVRRALVDFSHAPSLDRPDLRKNVAGPEGLAPSRSVLETNPSARTSRTYWCPRPVARRLPLFGRQPCICEHLSGESLVERDGYAPSPPHCKCGVLLLSLRPQSGHDGGTCTRDPQLCRLVPWLLGHVVKKLNRGSGHSA